MKNIEKKDLVLFGHGFFQDILTLMKLLDVEEITKKEVTEYRDRFLKPYKKTSGKRRQFGKPIPGARDINIKLKGKPCKGCKDKER